MKVSDQVQVKKVVSRSHLGRHNLRSGKPGTNNWQLTIQPSGDSAGIGSTPGDPISLRVRSLCCVSAEGPLLPKSKRGRLIKRLEGEELLVEHQQHMQTAEAKQLRHQRGSVIERTFGDLKEHGCLRRLDGRGQSRVEAEIGLLVLAHNLLTLHRLRRQTQKHAA